MSEELRECPFCGKSDKVTIYTDSMAHRGELLWIRYGVKCKRCHFWIPTYAKKEAAIHKWNSRPAEEALKAEIARYRRALYNLKEDCAQRKHFAVSDEEKMFLYETISHIDAELDFNTDTGKGGEDE